MWCPSTGILDSFVYLKHVCPWICGRTENDHLGLSLRNSPFRGFPWSIAFPWGLYSVAVISMVGSPPDVGLSRLRASCKNMKSKLKLALYAEQATSLLQPSSTLAEVVWAWTETSWWGCPTCTHHDSPRCCQVGRHPESSSASYSLFPILLLSGIYHHKDACIVALFTLAFKVFC